MLTPSPATWIVRGATFALWALAAGSAAFWGLKVSGSSRPLAVPAAPPRQVAPADPVSIAKLLGSSPAANAPVAVASVASRFQLLGVAAGVRSGEGAVVMSVDGKPPRSYRVGSPIDENYMLKSVHGREAVIASQRDGQEVAKLQVPQQKIDTTSRPSPMPLVPSAPPQVAPYVPPQPPAAATPAMPPQVPPPPTRGGRHPASEEPT